MGPGGTHLVGIGGRGRFGGGPGQGGKLAEGIVLLLMFAIGKSLSRVHCAFVIACGSC